MVSLSEKKVGDIVYKNVNGKRVKYVVAKATPAQAKIFGPKVLKRVPKASTESKSKKLPIFQGVIPKNFDRELVPFLQATDKQRWFFTQRSKKNNTPEKNDVVLIVKSKPTKKSQKGVKGVARVTQGAKPVDQKAQASAKAFLKMNPRFPNRKAYSSKNKNNRYVVVDMVEPQEETKKLLQKANYKRSDFPGVKQTTFKRFKKGMLRPQTQAALVKMSKAKKA